MTGMMDLPDDLLFNITKRFSRLSDLLSLRRTHPFFRREFPRFIKEADRLTFYVSFLENPDYEKYAVKIEMKKRITEYGPRREMHIAGINLKCEFPSHEQHAIIPVYVRRDPLLEELTDLLMVDGVILVDSDRGLAATSFSFKTGFQKNDKSVIMGCIRYFLEEKMP